MALTQAAVAPAAGIVERSSNSFAEALASSHPTFAGWGVSHRECTDTKDLRHEAIPSPDLVNA